MGEQSLSAGIDIKKTPRSVDSFHAAKIPSEMPKRKPGRPPAGPPRSLGGVRRADYSYQPLKSSTKAAATKPIENINNNAEVKGLEYRPSETRQFMNLISKPTNPEPNTPAKTIKTPKAQPKLTSQPTQNSSNIASKPLRKKRFADISAPLKPKQKLIVSKITTKVEKLPDEMGGNNVAKKKHFTPKSHPELLKDMKLSASAAEERLNNYLKYTVPIDQDSPGDMASTLYDLQLADSKKE